MDKASLEESCNCLKKWRDYYVQLLSEGLTESELKGFKNRIGNQISGALDYIQLIYNEFGLALGPNLSGLAEYANHQQYKFYLEGIARHIEDGQDQVNQANFLVEKSGEEREIREYISMIAPTIKRMR